MEDTEKALEERVTTLERKMMEVRVVLAMVCIGLFIAVILRSVLSWL